MERMTKLVLIVKNFLEATTLKTKDCSSRLRTLVTSKIEVFASDTDGGKPLIIVTI